MLEAERKALAAYRAIRGGERGEFETLMERPVSDREWLEFRQMFNLDLDVPLPASE